MSLSASPSSESNRSTAPPAFFGGTAEGAFFTGGARLPVAVTAAGFGGTVGFLGTLAGAPGELPTERLLAAVELRIGSGGPEAPTVAASSLVLSPTASDAAVGVGDVEARYDGFLATGGADALFS